MMQMAFYTRFPDFLLEVIVRHPVVWSVASDQVLLHAAHRRSLQQSTFHRFFLFLYHVHRGAARNGRVFQLYATRRLVGRPVRAGVIMRTARDHCDHINGSLSARAPPSGTGAHQVEQIRHAYLGTLNHLHHIAICVVLRNNAA